MSPAAEGDANYVLAGIGAFFDMLLLQKQSQNAQFYVTSNQFKLDVKCYSESPRLKACIFINEI